MITFVLSIKKLINEIMDDVVEDIPHYEGIVTSIYEKYCAVEINSKYTLHIAFNYLRNNFNSNDLHYLPSLNERITLNNVQKYSNHLLITNCIDSRVLSKFEHSLIEENRTSFLVYLNFILKHKLIGKEILKFYNYLSNGLKYDELLEIEETTETLLCRSIDIISTKFSNQMKFLTPSNVIKFHKSESNVEWSHVTQLNEQNNFLLGYLTVNNEGRMCIKDVKLEISCLIINKHNIDLKNFLNEIILLKRFVLIQEYYSSTTEKIFYVIFDIRDLFKVNATYKKKNQSRLIYTRPKELNNSLHFQLIEKFPPNISAKGHIQQYLLIHDIARNMTSYLCLESPLFSTVPLLDINCSYELFNWDKLENYKTQRLHLQDICGYRVTGNNILFYKSSTIDNNLTTNISKMLTSVEATIIDKSFSKPLRSFGILYPNVSGFDTPGTQTHGLKLLLKNDQRQYLYLNNWESLQNPLGLIPNMSVVINNVKLQKSYLKSTDITSFVIKGYELLPDECNLELSLILDDFMDDMEMPSDTPTTKSVDSDLMSFTDDVLMEEIEIVIRCKSCNKILSNRNCSPDCGSNDINNEFKATLRLKSNNDTRIYVDDISLMQSLFSIPDFLWENLLTNLITCKFHCSKLTDDHDVSNVQIWLQNAVNIFNERKKTFQMNYLIIDDKLILKSVITDYDKW